MSHALRASQELAERDRLRALVEAEQEERLFAYMADWRASQVRVWRAAVAEGREPPQPWPHPEDFFVDEVGQRWHIRDPSRLEDVDIYEAMRADRDVHHMRYVIDVANERTRMAAINRLFFLSYEQMLPKRWCKDIEGLEAQAHELLRYPLPVLEAALCSVERRALSLPRRPLSKEDVRDVYKSTNRLMLPLLKPMGYRSLKQFEAAYAERGKAMPWPRVAVHGT